ncbi:putative transcription factor bZIP family [Helianthus debilis subsp. tardiflorus]
MEAKEERPCLKYNKLPLTQEEIIQKREKRKQTNRDSAKRSRLRRQLELARLEVQVEVLIDEKKFLTKELKRISAKCERLASHNVSLKAELSQHIGPAEVPEVIDDLQSVADEGSN